VNTGQCSWHEFATAIFEHAGLTANLSAIQSAEYGAPARRPNYSVLGMDRLEVSLPPSWQVALGKYMTARIARMT
jgi:dTDP-4-dehydrorhamnose reductase